MRKRTEKLCDFLSGKVSQYHHAQAQQSRGLWQELSGAREGRLISRQLRLDAPRGAGAGGATVEGLETVVVVGRAYRCQPVAGVDGLVYGPAIHPSG